MMERNRDINRQKDQVNRKREKLLDKTDNEKKWRTERGEKGGWIIDNLQIDNQQIDNLTNFWQIDNLFFSKIDSALPLPCPHGLGNWHQGVVIFIMGEAGLSHSFTCVAAPVLEARKNIIQ